MDHVKNRVLFVVSYLLLMKVILTIIHTNDSTEITRIWIRVTAVSLNRGRERKRVRNVGRGMQVHPDKVKVMEQR